MENKNISSDQLHAEGKARGSSRGTSTSATKHAQSTQTPEGVQNNTLKKNSAWISYAPWLVVLCALVLASVVVVYDVRNAKRETAFTRQLIMEKGESLLFALEAALQTSAHFQWVDASLRDVLQRMGAQKNVLYLGIVDDEGVLQQIVLPESSKEISFSKEVLNTLEAAFEPKSSIQNSASGTPVFLVYKRVRIESQKHRHGHGAGRYNAPQEQLLLAGYDMAPIEEAQSADMRRTVILTAILLFLGLVGLFSFYLVRLYRLSCVKVEEANTMLLRQTRLAALGTMAAGVAHEVRNPLSSISAAARIIQESNPAESEENNLALVIRQEVSRLDKVVGDLLDFSRQDTVHKSRVYIEDCVRKAQYMVQEELDAKGIIFTVDMLQHPLFAFFDRDRMIQVLLNLFLNAIQAMPQGGKLTVTAVMTGRMAHNPARHTLLLEVSDNGVGIPEETMRELFSPYFTTKAKGTGLGLSIVHRIVEAHGGIITVKSTVGVGTTFSVRLPQNDEDRR